MPRRTAKQVDCPAERIEAIWLYFALNGREMCIRDRENIDYHALLQAVWNKAETVYAYRADGKNALSLDYRSSELFKQLSLIHI